MAEFKTTYTMTLDQQETNLVLAILQHVRLGETGWANVASNIAIRAEQEIGSFDETTPGFPAISFTLENYQGKTLMLSPGMSVTIETGE